MLQFTPNFQVGDVVQLKSGGPLMTVDGRDGTLVHCSWQDKTGKRTDVFEAPTLKLVGEPRVVRGTSSWTSARRRR
jgi:uncharacterized protein YodC (DUF2158 family)